MAEPHTDRSSESDPGDSVPAELVAVVMAVSDDKPVVRVVNGALPKARLRPGQHVCLDSCLRSTVEAATGLNLGHIEQLQAAFTNTASPTLSIGYLALAHRADGLDAAGPDQAGEVDASISDTHDSDWRSWYALFPWEDWRRGRPRLVRTDIIPQLQAWALEEDFADVPASQVARRHRLQVCFGDGEQMWDEEKVIERFDLLCDAGLIDALTPTVSMAPSERRWLAVAMSRLRMRIKSRPLVFDLMPQRFTLFELQRAVEAILGPHLHKQNFRRQVEHMGLVEPTDEMKSHTGGRPAKLFRFRQECVLENMQPGVRVRGSRG